MNKKEQTAIGVDIEGTKIIVALINNDGKILQRKQFPTNVKGGPEIIQQDIIKEIRELIKGQDKPKAIGVGMAGQISPESGMVKFAPNLGWHNIDLQGVL